MFAYITILIQQSLSDYNQLAPEVRFLFWIGDHVSMVKGIHNPQYLPNDFFALSTFLDDLKPFHLNLSIQICP